MSMDIYTPIGTTVILSEHLMYSGFMFDVENEVKYLKLNESYVVSNIINGEFHTSVFLEEFPGIPFNSINFFKKELNKYE